MSDKKTITYYSNPAEFESTKIRALEVIEANHNRTGHLEYIVREDDEGNEYLQIDDIRPCTMLEGCKKCPPTRFKLKKSDEVPLGYTRCLDSTQLNFTEIPRTSPEKHEEMVRIVRATAQAMEAEREEVRQMVAQLESILRRASGERPN